MQIDNSQAKTVAPTPEYVKEEGKNHEEPATTAKTLKDPHGASDKKPAHP